ncbi:YcgL domain-containing protein [Pseudidiomarina mangrovi]|uniref:YcgL domain-containing protein n=1 Tax=Pseudidiomarina mangrovi TaxID=2487133 RepID=UPI000FCC8E34|nr:YcgL domain-containing protein [Pseudidiomarina mangrovi]CAI8166590.1 MAG: Protein YcgL [Pseudidiomarina mangrovi]
MLCAIYRSSRRADTYLYMPHPADFSKLPEPLRQHFGQPIEVMVFALKTERKLAHLSVDELRRHLDQPGYYLQLPPPVENLLKQHKESQG